MEPSDLCLCIVSLKRILQLFFCSKFWDIYSLWSYEGILTLYLTETPFNAFATRADPDQAALAACSGSTLFAYQI